MVLTRIFRQKDIKNIFFVFLLTQTCTEFHRRWVEVNRWSLAINALSGYYYVGTACAVSVLSAGRVVAF